MEQLNEILKREYYHNSVQDWLIALAVLLATWLVLRLVKSFVLKQLGKVTSRTRNHIDDVVVRALGHTKWFTYAAASVYVAAHFLTLSDTVGAVIRVGAVILLIVQIGVWLQAMIRYGIDAWTETRAEAPGTATMAAAIGFLSRLALWSVVLLLVLSNVGIEIGPLIAGLGVGGIAAALALQTVLGDLFASLSIYFDRPFDIGDFIIVGDFLGTVQKIGLRSTRLKSLGGEQLIFANSDMVSSRIRNYKRMQERRISFEIGVVYGTPFEKVKKIPEIIKGVVESDEGLRFDRSHFKSYGDYSLIYETIYWVLSPDYNVYMDKQQTINFALYERFEKEGIEFAFPTQTLYVHKADGASA